MEPTGIHRGNRSPSSAETLFPLCLSSETLLQFASTAKAGAVTTQPHPGTKMPGFLNSQRHRPSTPSHSTENRATPIHDGNSPAVIPTVLVVEDDPDISMALRDLLEFEGFRVDCAETFRQAVSFIGERAYDIVLLDLGLPDGDGATILEQLQETHPSLPVIVLTATNRDLESLHPYAHLTKPWQRAELCRLVHRAIGTLSSSSQN